MADNRRLIEKVIETDPVIKKGLQRGIINGRALARFIQESDGVDSSPEAILGIIRRYPLPKESTAGAYQILGEGELTMRSKMADLLLENSPEVMERVLEFAKSNRTTRGENLSVTVGVRSIRVTAEQKALDQFREEFRDKDVLAYARNLVEISILLPMDAWRTKGIVGRIATELALNDVNLFSIMASCPPEPTVLVDEKVAPRAAEVLQKMISEIDTAKDYVRHN